MPNQVIWITASAGTGKTTALINRYKTLLQTCKPEQIIGITFTINAAEEIKERLALRDDRSDGTLRIQTIHSLCHQLLSSYTAKNISILDPNEKTVLIDQALRMVLNEPTELTKRLAERFSFYHLQNLMEKIAAHLPDRQHVIADKPRDFDFTDVPSVFEPIEPNEKIIAAFQDHALVGALQMNYADVFLTKTGEVRKRILDASTAKQYPDLVLIMQDEAHRVYALMQERFAQEWLYDNNLMHKLADRVWEHYKNLKQHRLDYDELINATQTMLENDVARYDICRSIYHVLLDEAQDTNPKQWRIIELLTQHLFDDPTTSKSFFVVGDHKQAIYGFQNASPEFMEQQKQKYKSAVGEGFIEESLQVNYRSVNTVCDYVEAQCLSPGVQVAREHTGFVLEVTDFDETLAKFLNDPPFLPSQNRP
jgi:ATP-dependent exoDNAse (exonuclease V) beta subunit